MALMKPLKGKGPGDQEIIIIQEGGHGGSHDDESNWLVSYADMMTLLCGFFIMMFSMAKLDEPKYEKVKEAVAKQFGGEYKSPTENMTKFMSQVMQEMGVDKDAILESDPTGVTITMQSLVFFDTLSADVTPQGKAILDKLVSSIKGRQDVEFKRYKIVIEGHTDSRPILGGQFNSNWELSGSRASRVVRLFLDQGFAPDQLTAIGYADTYPIVPSRSPAGEWIEPNLSKNRRVVLRILEPKVDSIPYPNAAAPAQPEQPAPNITAPTETK